jgi:hypothetical protein
VASVFVQFLPGKKKQSPPCLLVLLETDPSKEIPQLGLPRWNSLDTAGHNGQAWTKRAHRPDEDKWYMLRVHQSQYPNRSRVSMHVLHCYTWCVHTTIQFCSYLIVMSSAYRYRLQTIQRYVSKRFSANGPVHTLPSLVLWSRSVKADKIYLMIGFNTVKCNLFYCT